MGDDFAPGHLIADKFRVVRELGRGGMGVVLAADHLELQQTVAVKLMKASGNAVALERFKREARLVARLRSQHVCRVFDVGTLDSGEPFIVMEMLEGGDLGEVLDQQGPLTVAQVAEYVVQALDAIGEAHLLGVVHRDIKPGNLFLARGVDGAPFVKVLDFGISKASGQDDGLTATGELIGSPRFMAPEQMKKAADVDTRADVWALGAVMYELLAGAPAFDADTVAELLVLILQEEPEPLASARRDLPPAFVAVVERCLRKSPVERFANVAELALALEPFLPTRAKPYVQRLVTAYEATGWTPPASMGATQAGGSSASAPTASSGTTAMPLVPAPSSPIGAAASATPAAASSTFAATATPGPSAAPPTPQRVGHAQSGYAASPTIDPSAQAGPLQAGPLQAGPPGPVHGLHGSAGYAPAATVAAPHPRKSSAPIAVIAALGGLVFLVGAGVVGWLLLSDAPDDAGARSPTAEAPHRDSRSGDSAGATAFPSEGQAMFDEAEAFHRDAVKRNAGHDVVVFIKLYASGLAQVALQAHDEANRVMRWEYKGGELWREMNYTKHATKPVAATTISGVDLDVVSTIRRDAMKRSAAVAGDGRKIFMIGLDKSSKGQPEWRAFVEGEDADVDYIYDLRGRFVR